ncbi:hypothetical protein ACP4OV_010313 [Aristida adscensionis]
MSQPALLCSSSPSSLLHRIGSRAMEAAKLGLGLGGALTLGLLRRRPSSCSSSWSGGAASAAPSMVAIGSTPNKHRWSPAASLGAATTSMSSTSTEKEDVVVFVAGATGRVGSRAVRELIKLGFRVRAAVRDAQRASALLQSVQQLGLDGAAERLEMVECDLEKQAQESIASAIGNAALVVCSIGASEKDILDVTGPYRIDYMATNNLLQAATAAKVEHFILVTSLGTNKIGFPAFLLNLFWGVLLWKRRAEEALIASGIPYTIVRPGGMERPTDAYKETHNLVVAAEDTYVGGQVSNLQVAELIAYMARNRKAAYCKVVEVIAETTAPPLPFHQLLSTVPSNRQPPADQQQQEKVSASTALETPPPPPTEKSRSSDEAV